MSHVTFLQEILRHVFIRKKRVHYSVDRHTGGPRESCLPGNLNWLYGAFFLGFLWPSIFIRLVLSPYLVYLSNFLEKEMATQSSVLAWRIPGMGKLGGLPSMGSHRVRHD